MRSYDKSLTEALHKITEDEYEGLEDKDTFEDYTLRLVYQTEIMGRRLELYTSGGTYSISVDGTFLEDPGYILENIKELYDLSKILGKKARIPIRDISDEYDKYIANPDNYSRAAHICSNTVWMGLKNGLLALYEQENAR